MSTNTKPLIHGLMPADSGVWAELNALKPRLVAADIVCQLLSASAPWREIHEALREWEACR